MKDSTTMLWGGAAAMLAAFCVADSLAGQLCGAAGFVLLVMGANEVMQEGRFSRTQEMRDQVCAWTHDETHDKWDTECGQAWLLSVGSPRDNDMRYCPFCGGKLVDQS